MPVQKERLRTPWGDVYKRQVYGSVFGFENALDPVYHALGMEGKPVEVMESATMLLIMAISIGAVSYTHLPLSR